jgi:hypothetical protein
VATAATADLFDRLRIALGGLLFGIALLVPLDDWLAGLLIGPALVLGATLLGAIPDAP